MSLMTAPPPAPTAPADGPLTPRNSTVPAVYALGLPRASVGLDKGPVGPGGRVRTFVPIAAAAPDAD